MFRKLYKTSFAKPLSEYAFVFYSQRISIIDRTENLQRRFTKNNLICIMSISLVTKCSCEMLEQH